MMSLKTEAVQPGIVCGFVLTEGEKQTLSAMGRAQETKLSSNSICLGEGSEISLEIEGYAAIVGTTGKGLLPFIQLSHVVEHLKNSMFNTR